jgi:hypothetical protein
MKDLLFNPNLFFSEKSKNEVNLKYPVLIMLVNCIIQIGLFSVVINQTRGSLPSNANSFTSIMIFFIAIIALIGTFGLWIILTGIFYLISSVFNSKGSFKRTLEFVGYGFVPLIFSSILGFLASYISLSSLSAESLKQTLVNNPLSLISQIFGIICILLSANIWVFALLHARNMSTKNAIITVVIPIGLYLFWHFLMLKKFLY